MWDEDVMTFVYMAPDKISRIAIEIHLTAAERLAALGDSEGAAEMLRARNEQGATLLHIAATLLPDQNPKYALNQVQRLLDAGHPKDVVDDNGARPLRYAIENSIEGSDEQITRLFIERGDTVRDLMVEVEAGYLSPLCNLSHRTHDLVRRLDKWEHQVRRDALTGVAEAARQEVLVSPEEIMATRRSHDRAI